VTLIHFQKKLAERLVGLRTGADLTHEEVARRAGLTRQHLQRLEEGRINPTVGTLLSLARVFGQSLTELVGSLE
jgi:transcriptional regulator with XRE-family HTH domain